MSGAKSTPPASTDGVGDALRAALMQAGAKDPDLVAFLDRAEVETDKAGAVTNAADLVAALRVAKPYLFGADAPKTLDQMTPTQKRKAAAAIGITDTRTLSDLHIDQPKSTDPRPNAAPKSSGRHIDEMTPEEQAREARALGLPGFTPTSRGRRDP